MSPHVGFQSDTPAVWDALCAVSGKLAFDIGANGGLVSRMLAEHFESVVACEPAHESYNELLEDIPENVKPLNIAVSDVDGPLQLRETTLTGRWGELFTDDTLPWGEHLGYRTVEAVTLDALSDEYGSPDFLKIDTEGHEVHVLQGGSRTLRSDPAFVIEVHSSEKGSHVQNLLSMFGLSFVVHHHAAYRASSPHRLEHYWVTSPGERLGTA